LEKMCLYLKEKKAIKKIPGIERFALRLKLSELLDRPMDKTMAEKERNEKVYTSHVYHGYTMKEIAQKLHIHYLTVSKIIKNVKSRRTRPLEVPLLKRGLFGF